MAFYTFNRPIRKGTAMASRSTSFTAARTLGMKGRRSLMSSPQQLRYALPSGDLINAILQYADVCNDMGGGRVMLRLSAAKRADPIIAGPLGREAPRLADVAILWDEVEDEIIRVLDAASGDHLEPVPAPAAVPEEEPRFALTPSALDYLAASGGAA